MQALVDDIISTLTSLSSEKRREFGNRTYPSAMTILGVTVPDLRKVLVELKYLTKNWEPIEKLKLAIELVNCGFFECQQLAQEWIGRDSKLSKLIGLNEANKLQLNMDNWVSTDTYATLILGPLWQRGVISDYTILKSLKSPDFWKRRLAVAATVALNRKRKGYFGDSKRTLLICDQVVDDHHDMVVKALSWALRSLIPWDPEAVRLFLNEHKEVLHKRVVREVENKLETGYKS